jgi:hypothetical protein
VLAEAVPALLEMQQQMWLEAEAEVLFFISW